MVHSFHRHVTQVHTQATINSHVPCAQLVTNVVPRVQEAHAQVDRFQLKVKELVHQGTLTGLLAAH
jgi:hypothetical protein